MNPYNTSRIGPIGRPGRVHSHIPVTCRLRCGVVGDARRASGVVSINVEVGEVLIDIV